MPRNNISWFKPAVAALIVVAAACSCDDDKSEPEILEDPYSPAQGGTGGISDAGYSLGLQSAVFGFTAQNRYAYCPSAMSMPDGSTEIYFCGNPVPDVMIDNIYHTTLTPDGNHTTARSVMQPGITGSWDSHHTCDPSVVKGTFSMDGHQYAYAMFYLGCSTEYYYNEVGVAFADTPDATAWIKYPFQIVTKGWDSPGDLEYAPGARCWGTGQPSAVSLDKKGKVLLTYTIGNLQGTRLMAREIDFSDMSHPVISSPVTISTQGLSNSSNSGSDIICNADIAIEPASGTMLMIRPVQPHADTYPSYISSIIEICSMPAEDFRTGIGRWKQLYRIGPEQTGYPRNHNAALHRDEYGYVANIDKIGFYYTTSREAPDVAPAEGKHAEWTYSIRRGSIER